MLLIPYVFSLKPERAELNQTALFTAHYVVLGGILRLCLPQFNRGNTEKVCPSIYMYDVYFDIVAIMERIRESDIDLHHSVFKFYTQICVYSPVF